MRLIIDVARLVSKLLGAFKLLIYTHLIHKILVYAIKYIPAPLIMALKPLSPIFTNGFTYIKNIQAIVGTLLLFNITDLSSLLNPFELLNVLNNYATIIKTMLYNFSDKYFNIQIEMPQDKPIAKVKIDVEPPKTNIDYSKINIDQIPPRPKIDEPLFSLRECYKDVEIKESTFWDKYGTYICYGIAGVVIIGGIVYICYTWNFFGGTKPEAGNNNNNNNNSEPKGFNPRGNGDDLSDGISDTTTREQIQERLRRLAKGKARANELIFDAGEVDTIPNSPSLSQKERMGLSPTEGSYRREMDKYFQVEERQFPLDQPGSSMSSPLESEALTGIAPSVLSDEESRLIKLNDQLPSTSSEPQGFLQRINSWISPNPGSNTKIEVESRIGDELSNVWQNHQSSSPIEGDATPLDGSRTPRSGDNTPGN